MTKFGGYAVDPSPAPGAKPLPADPILRVYCRGDLHPVTDGVCGGCGKQLNWLVTR